MSIQKTVKDSAVAKKICAVLLTGVLLALGIACGGGGGGSSSAVVWPVLPEGALYLNEDGLGLNNDYAEVVPGGPLDDEWLVSSLWLKCYGEDGFILAIEPVRNFSPCFLSRGTGSALISR